MLLIPMQETTPGVNPWGARGGSPPGTQKKRREEKIEVKEEEAEREKREKRKKMAKIFNICLFCILVYMGGSHLGEGRSCHVLPGTMTKG
jgi:hypothetical protein